MDGYPAGPLGYRDIPRFRRALDDCRGRIVRCCRDLGYAIPLDEERAAAGLEPIHLCDIKNWLWRREDLAVAFSTTDTDVCYLDPSLRDYLRDLEVQWDYDPSEPSADVYYISSDSDPVIRHDYPSKGVRDVTLYSPVRMDKVCDYAFLGNVYVAAVDTGEAVSEIGRMAFYGASNLTSVTFGRSLRTIGEMAFGGTNIKRLDLSAAASLEQIVGSEPFYSKGLSAITFDVGEDSRLNTVKGHWTFNFGRELVPGGGTVTLPSGCRFYNANGTELKPENDAAVISAWNPFSRSYDRFAFAPGRHQHLSADAFGAVYLKNAAGVAETLLSLPYTANAGKRGGWSLPASVKRIAMGAFMSTGSNAAESATIDLPATVEYVHPDFEHWGYGVLRFSCGAGGNYVATASGGLMTYSSLGRKARGEEPDVFLYQPSLTADTFQFPSSFSQTKDFRGAEINQRSLVPYSMQADTVALSRDFPWMSPTPVGNGLWTPSCPYRRFQVPDDSQNYTVYDGCLYLKYQGNDHYALVAVPGAKAGALAVHPDCRVVGSGSCSSRSRLTGTFSAPNATVVGYQAFAGSGFSEIRLSKVQNCGAYRCFCDMPNLSAVYLGPDTRHLNSWLFGNDPRLRDVYIQSKNVVTVHRIMFQPKFAATVTVHIPFYDGDGAETATYRNFKNAGFSATKPNVYNVQLADWRGSV